MSSFSYLSPGLSRLSSSERISESGLAQSPFFVQDSPDWILLGRSMVVRQLRSQIHRIAPYFRVALVRGETGAGKELAARTIHALSPAAEGNFVSAPAGVFAESVAAGEVA